MTPRPVLDTLPCRIVPSQTIRRTRARWWGMLRGPDKAHTKAKTSLVRAVQQLLASKAARISETATEKHLCIGVWSQKRTAHWSGRARGGQPVPLQHHRWLPAHSTRPR